MSKTKIEQYPNSLMAVSKLFSKRSNYFNTDQINIDNPERDDFYKNKEQYKKNIEDILTDISNIDIYIDELNPLLNDIFTPASSILGLTRKLIQDLSNMNKLYKDKILKKSKNYNLYDLQEIENNINILNEKYNDLLMSSDYKGYIKANGQVDPLFKKIKEIFKVSINLIKQTSQIQPMKGSGIHKINYNTVDKYLGGSLYCCADSLAN